MDEFTPGPWRAEKCPYSRHWMVKTPRGIIRGNAISDIGEADAHLIAAAPELYLACKTALSGFSYRALNGDEEALADAKLLKQTLAKVNSIREIIEVVNG